jgi:ABC-type branched-subunit amino acid transport system ATPase component
VVVPEMTVRDNLELGAHILKGDRARIAAATERVTQLFRCSRSAWASSPAP